MEPRKFAANPLRGYRGLFKILQDWVGKPGVVMVRVNLCDSENDLIGSVSTLAAPKAASFIGAVIAVDKIRRANYAVVEVFAENERFDPGELVFNETVELTTSLRFS